MFLAVRLYCSFVMEFDIHTLLDLATLATTLWVIFMIRFKLRSSYMEEKDNFAIYYVVSSCHSYLFIHQKLHLYYFPFLRMILIYKICYLISLTYSCLEYSLQVIPCAVLALVIHPSTSHHILNKILWAFCVYLEAVSVLPQLRVMQNTKVHSFTQKHCSYNPGIYSVNLSILAHISPHTFRLLSHSQLIMYLHWVQQDF